MSDTGYTHLLSAPLTKNWFVLRHGRSEANEAGIVASQLANAEQAFGLTETGRSEVTASVRTAAGMLQANPPLLVLMSPFLRTRQTAEIAGELLGLCPETDARLRERDFGDFELRSDDHYQQVWDADPEQPDPLPGRAESVYAVAERSCQVILDVEQRPDIQSCLLVTHCDVAMILTCAVQQLDPCHHRSLDPIQTGEVRRLTPASS